MNKIKKIVLSMSMILLGTTLVACNNGDKVTSDTPPNEVVIAKVGEKEITLDKFNKEFNYAIEEVKAGYGDEHAVKTEVKENLKKQVLDNLVNREVLLNEAEKQKIKITEEEIEKEFTNIKGQFKTDEEFNTAIKKENTTVDQLKEQIVSNMKLNKIMTSIKIDTNVTDKEIEKYYNDNIEQFKIGPGAEMYHILVPTEEEAKKIKSEYDAGTKFEDLASKYGTDGSKDVGGLLGFKEYDATDFDQDFLVAAKKLKEGEVSSPINTKNGWHLIKVQNINNEGKTAPLDKLKPQISYFIQRKKISEGYKKYIDGLKKDLNVKIYEEKIII